ncbi:hypothetical protein [Halocatena salina]|uniref:Uncharacterized protein n=1 Tax=Halocatena salina TaxID=2934340 RepID=A0A8U0A3G1_9EURY|nr:hypothetical protein [Halocatena salina]UPM43574.1 hypothetical protein MW046_03785 [Halocatena salina]
MGLLDRVKSYFREEEQTTELNRQHRGDQFGDLPEEIEEMPPEDVADKFVRMQQQTRLDFIQSRYISHSKWKEVMNLIENDPKQRVF